MIKLIAVVDADFGVSKHGAISWSFRQDRLFFRKHTENSVVVMGRRTLFSIPNPPLRNRVNCVLSRRYRNISGTEVFSDIDSLLKKYTDFWIIGGAEIYNEFLEKNLVEYALITRMKDSFDADKFMNKSFFAKFSQKQILNTEKYSVEEYTKRSILI